MELITRKKLNARINTIKRSVSTLRANAQEVALNCIMYRDIHGDCDFATRLVNAFGEVSGEKMKRYLKDFGAMTWNEEKQRFKINKKGTVDISAARNVLWYQYTKEHVTTELDRARALSRLKKLLGDISSLPAADIVPFSAAINDAHNLNELRQALAS